MARRKGQICVLFDTVPPDTTYREGAYAWVDEPVGFEYIEKGYGEEYNPVNKKTEELPAVAPEDDYPEDFPDTIKAICKEDKREFAEVKELYEDDHLQDINGVGESTETKIKTYFGD